MTATLVTTVAASALPRSYWAATAAPAANCPPLAGPVMAEVCVIGGGYLGLSAALHLAEAGTDVVLLEAAEPGWGASGRNGGQIIPGFKVERSALVATLGEERGQRLFAWSGGFVDVTLELIARHGIDCQASQPGWIQPAHAAKSLAAYDRRVAEWQAAGIAARTVGRDEAAAMLGTGWYVGAYVDPRGGRLQPLSFARGLARAAMANGARIFAHSPAATLTRHAGGWRIATPHGHVDAAKVLISTNAYTDGGTPLIAGLAQSVVPLPSYMLATAPLSDNLRRTILPGGETAADLKRLVHHFRVEPDGSLLFGGRGSMADHGRPQDYRAVERKLAEIFPQLGEQPIAYRWSGQVAITLDGLPHIHRPAAGLWAALGCNGRGVGMATTAGKLLAELIRGLAPEASPIPVNLLRRIPFHTLRLTGVRLAGWWKNQRDEMERRG